MLAARLAGGQQIAIAIERDRLRAENQGLLAELERRTQWAEEQAALAEERLQWALALKEEACGYREERDRMIEVATQLEEERRSLTDQLQARERSLAEREAALATLTAQLDQTERRLANILDSRSWRYTAPLRSLAARLRRLRDRWRFRLRRSVGLLRGSERACEAAVCSAPSGTLFAAVP